jgi:hypothetical protein
MITAVASPLSSSPATWADLVLTYELKIASLV